MKKLIVLFLSLIICLSFAFNAYAQEARELELEYPLIQGDQPETVAIPVPEYVRYIFNFAVWAAGILALLVLIYAGIQYFLSTGNPEKITIAKERITSALIGLLILFGSYLILWSINPGLVTFELLRLRPIISELSPGILVCKQEVPVDRAWAIMVSFPHVEDWQQELWAEELETIRETITEHCYSILTQGNIRSDFDDQIRDVYFIPGEQTIGGVRYIALYAAALYEHRNYEGRTETPYDHFLDIGGVNVPVHLSIGGDFDISSIQPFVLIPQHHETIAAVTLYQKPNQNQKLEGPEFTEALYPMPPNIWFASFDIMATEGGEGPAFWRDTDGDEEIEYHAPESIWVNGNFVAILSTGESEPYDDLNDNGRWDAGGWIFGRDEPYIDINDNNQRDAVIDRQSVIFFNEIDNSLLDDKNITGEKACRKFISSGPTMGPGGGGAAAWTWTRCVEPASEQLVIISAEIY